MSYNLIRLLIPVAFLSGAVFAQCAMSAMQADSILVEKSERRLTLLKGGVAFKTYSIALGSTPEGAKEIEGDRKTPEGHYVIDRRKADSAFHRALHVSYPDQADTARAKAAGATPGGDVTIHGLKNGFGWLGRFHRVFDWTRGCIAVTNQEIEEIWAAVPDGTPIEIRP